MKIYCSNNPRKSKLEKLVGKDIWFQLIQDVYPYKVKWVQIKSIIRDRIYGCYAVYQSALDNSPDDLESRQYLYQITHELGMAPYPIKLWKDKFEEAIDKGEYLTTEELFGYTEEELTAEYQLDKYAEED